MGQNARVSHTHELRVWRPPLAERVADVALSGGLMVLMVVTLKQAVTPCSGDACWADTGTYWSWIGMVLTGGFGAFFLSAALSFARLGSHSLVVRQPFWRTIEVPLTEIDHAGTGSYLGVRIVRAKGKPFTIWALQESNFSVWTNRTTRADLEAAEIRDAVVQARDTVRGA